MKKTVNINISGIAFTIDEDAYDKLNLYLNQINKRYKHEQGGNEIISDIEARIAELFRERTGNIKQVISIEDVNAVIGIMGSPDDFSEETEIKDDNSPKVEYTSKRLYRDPDDRVFGGVCSGLGAYFNVDSIIIRIIAVILFFAFGTGIMIYLLLWLIIPKARTNLQKFEMRGEKINVENIERSFREEYNEVKENLGKFRQSKSYKSFLEVLNKFFQATGQVLGTAFKAIALILGVFLLISGILIIVMSPRLLGNSAFSVNIFSFPELFTTSTNAALIVIGSLLVVGIPVLALCYVGLKLIFRFKSNDRVIGLTATIFFIFGLLMFIIFGLAEINNFRDDGKISEEYTLNKLKTDTLYLKASEDSIEKKDSKYDNYIELHKLIITSHHGDYSIYSRPELDIEKSKDSNIHLIVKKYSKGMGNRHAKTNAGSISYSWSTNDSVVFFDPYFSIDKETKWRGQQLYITLEIPEGKIVYLDDNLNDIIYDIDNTSNTADEEMLGKMWIMKPEGLTKYN